MEQKQQLKNILRKFFARERGVLFCYLFGSFARGDALGKSDVDIAVYFLPQERTDFFEVRLRFMEKLSRALGKDVDVIVLNIAPPFLRYVVVQEGLVLFEKDRGARIDFELKAINEYLDFKQFLRHYDKKLIGLSR